MGVKSWKKPHFPAFLLPKKPLYYILPNVAKKKGNRNLIGLECKETGRRTYVTQKNRVNTTDKIELMKYNPKLRKHTLHKEVTRLK